MRYVAGPSIPSAPAAVRIVEGVLTLRGSRLGFVEPEESNCNRCVDASGHLFDLLNKTDGNGDGGHASRRDAAKRAAFDDKGARVKVKSEIASSDLAFELARYALEVRKDLLKLCTQTQIHIGGDLSVTDVMCAIWQHFIVYDPERPHWEGRDRFVLSKGHASAVTSFNQARRGCFDVEDIYKEYASDNGRFGMHSCNLVNPYVDVSTGSLGHGLPVACGLAQGLRLKGNMTSRVWVVMGDGELDEGSIWEAAACAAKYGLGNLVGVVDNNHLQLDGPTREVLDLGGTANRFADCGWNVIEVEDGNDMPQIVEALEALPTASSATPTVVVCETTKGRGVSFMENDKLWHCAQIDGQAYQAAVDELEQEFTKKWGER